MFNIEELRKNNRTSLFISSFAAQIAAMAAPFLTMVLGSAHPRGRTQAQTDPNPSPDRNPKTIPDTPPVISV